MFEKLKKLVEEAKKRAATVVDPAVFNHPLAQKTEWSPLAGGGSNFKTHRLDHSNRDKLVFKATLGAQLFSGVFILFGLFGLIFPTYIFFSQDKQEWSMIVFAVFFGGIFTAAGMFLLHSMARPRVFDTFYGYYYEGWKKPADSMVSHTTAKRKITQLNEVEAIQVLRERLRSKNGSYYSYEINLVLADTRRVNVIDHGNQQAVIDDAEILAQTLGVPLWDGS